MTLFDESDVNGSQKPKKTLLAVKVTLDIVTKRTPVNHPVHRAATFGNIHVMPGETEGADREPARLLREIACCIAGAVAPFPSVTV